MTQKMIKGLGVMAVVVLILTACDRIGRAPADLDVTPTVAPTAVPTQVAEGEATPVPDDAASNLAEDIPARVEAVRAQIPANITAGAVTWRSAGADQKPPRIENGDGVKVFFTEQVGGQANLTYGVFNTPEDAQAHYEFIEGLRSNQTAGKVEASLPEPNLYWTGVYGSYAIFHRDRYFVEVAVEAYSGVGEHPLVPLARRALEYLDAGIQEFETPDVKPQRMDALVALIPEQIDTGLGVFQRQGEVTVSDTIIEDAVTAIANYAAEDGGTARITYAVFDTPEDLQVAYDAQVALPKSETLRIDLSAGDVNSEFPEPNRFNTAGLQGSSLLMQFGDIYLLDVELFTPSGEDLMTPFVQEALRILEEGIAAYSG